MCPGERRVEMKSLSIAAWFAFVATTVEIRSGAAYTSASSGDVAEWLKAAVC